MDIHHAVLLVSPNFTLSGYASVLSKEETELEHFTFVTLAIADVRTIINSAHHTPLVSPTKTLIITASTIAIEAQQALLKILEEPPLSTKFVLVLKSIEGLLPTLLSRLHMVSPQVQLDSTNTLPFENFLAANYAGRLEQIAKMTKDKDVTGLELVKDGLVKWLKTNAKHNNSQTILWCIEKMSLRGSSKKMLLEEIAFTLPVVATAP